MPKRYDAAVIGGGASGIVAAIAAARRGRTVILLERMPRLGKKILITGGGRCNLANENLDPALYTSRAPALVARVFARFGHLPIRLFFKDIGLETVSEGGRVFPATNQAASVLKVLELEIARLAIPVVLNFDVVRIDAPRESFTVLAADGRGVESKSVILTGGGKSYPALGSNGSGYRLAAPFGHDLVLPVPSAVPLLVKDRLCHLLQGQKVRARVSALIDGAVRQAAEGDVLFTVYGLSGTAVLDVSESLSVALHRESGRSLAVSLDLVPFMKAEALAAEFARRLRSGWSAADLLSGILPEKFHLLAADILSGMKVSDHGAAAAALASGLKDKRFPVQGTRGWNEAEFTTGGIDAREVDIATLESRFRKRLHLAGEILDVQGGRGGYNLAWAWASGHVAGESV
jgi:predicted Rossmann fold flavoprotein